MPANPLLPKTLLNRIGAEEGLEKILADSPIDFSSDELAVAFVQFLVVRNALETYGIAAASQVEAEAGALGTLRAFSPLRIKQAIMALVVGAAPSGLDTLAEIAAALGNDANFAATMGAALATKIEATRKIASVLEWEQQSSNFSAAAGHRYNLTASLTMSLPSSGMQDNDEIEIKCAIPGTVLVFDPSVSAQINGASNLTLAGPVRGAFVYRNGAGGWEFVSYDDKYLRRSENLADLPDAETARANLGLGSAATAASESFAPAGDYAVLGNDAGFGSLTATGAIETSGDTIHSNHPSGMFKINGQQVLTVRQSAINNAAGTGSLAGGSDMIDAASYAALFADHQSAINAILAAMREHGLIAI